MSPSILFIGKKKDFYCERAMEFVKAHFPEHGVLPARLREKLFFGGYDRLSP